MIDNNDVWMPSIDEVQKLAGPECVRVEHTRAKLAALKLRRLLEEKDYLHAMGAVTGNQAMQMVKAGMEAIYLSGWQVAADANDSLTMYPDQSLYSVNSGPMLAEKINNAFTRSAQIEWLEAKGDYEKWLCPIIADAEAGFGGALNAYELMAAYIKAGAAGVHFEDQLSSAKKCGHLGGKVLVPASEFIKKLKAARLAAEVCGTRTVIIARTDANSAKLLTSAIDDADAEFLTMCDGSKPRESFVEQFEVMGINSKAALKHASHGHTTSEGFYNITGGIDMAINRGLQYAPYADLLWCETGKPNLDEARKFADAIHAQFPHQKLAYNCFHEDTEFITNVGTKTFVDFKDGDVITVLTHLGNWKPAIVKSYGKQHLQTVSLQKGKGTKIHEIKVTQNHRWLLSNGTETINLKPGDKVLSAPENYYFDFDNADPFEKLYWCYGYVYGDGTKIKKNGNYNSSLVRLCKRDVRYKERFEEVGFKTSTNFSLDGDCFAYTGTYLKTLPDLDRDSPELIRAFVNGLLAADGAKVTNGNGFRYKSIQATGQESIDFLKRSLPMCGFYISRIEDYTDQVTNYGKRSDVTKRINISYNKSKHNIAWTVTMIEGEQQNPSTESFDVVWCLEVEDDASFVLPMGMSTGNCSPSFNWKKHLDDETISKFQRELGTMGYSFQFVTLAGFHCLNYHMFDLASAYEAEDMTAYARLQEWEFDRESEGYTAHKHQREVGVPVFDTIAQIVDKKSSTLAEKGSTEEEQF